jgi:hypothetical protein
MVLAVSFVVGREADTVNPSTVINRDDWLTILSV